VTETYMVIVRVAGNTDFRNVLVNNAKTKDHARLAAYFHFFPPQDEMPKSGEVYSHTGGFDQGGPFRIHNIVNAAFYVVPSWHEEQT